jgi:hypothetical protein
MQAPNRISAGAESEWNVLGFKVMLCHPSRMGSKTDMRRRWAGAFCLLAALAMLIAGQTVLRERLQELAFILFWAVCFAFTCLAILIAFWDVAVTRRQVREEQRALLEDTLEEIARRKRLKSPTPPDREDKA